MLNVAFHTLGCKVNQYETEAMMEQFVACGYTIVDFDAIADIYIVNTCTVTNIADQKSRQMLSKAKKRNEAALVVAVGCYVQLAHEQLEQYPYIDILVGNTHKNQLVEIVEKYVETRHRQEYIEDVHGDVLYEELHIDMQHSKTRSTIKIQDGCNQYCTYCIIPYTRGKIRSRHIETVIAEVERLVQSGFQEIILTGIHLASYGKDLDDTSLIELLKKLNALEGLQRIRLGSLEPTFITAELLNKLVLLKKVCDHFHLSMQSGSDSVLDRMNRRYTSEIYFEKVNLLRAYYKNPAITTDVIVGFPMETEEEASETYEFVKKVHFSEMHIFKYSIREGTKAAAMKPQVAGTIKNERSKQLTAIAQMQHESFITALIGHEVEVLFEEAETIDGSDYIGGYTTNYVKVYVALGASKDASKDASNEYVNDDSIKHKILKVVPNALFKDGLLGK